MTKADMIEWETKIRHLAHRAERRQKALHDALEEFAGLLAEHHSIAAAERSGPEDKPDDTPTVP